MKLKIVSTVAFLAAATLSGCATKSDLAREDRGEELRTAAIKADMDREARNQEVSRQIVREAAIERASQKPF